MELRYYKRSGLEHHPSRIACVSVFLPNKSDNNIGAFKILIIRREKKKKYFVEVQHIDNTNKRLDSI